MAPKKRKAANGAEGTASRMAKAPAAPPRSIRITRSMTTDGPRQAVFNTAELLEAILLEVPMKQLFVLRRVSKQFNDCVNTSVKLQEKMFLRPSQTEKEVWTLRTQAPTSAFTMPECEFVPALSNLTNAIEDGQDFQVARLNPFLHAELVLGYRAATFRCSVNNGDRLELSAILARLQKLPGTWQDMHITDPICTAVILGPIRVDLNTDPPLCVIPRGRSSISQPAGIKVGDLIKHLMNDNQTVDLVHPGNLWEKKVTNISALLVQYAGQKKKKGPLIKQIEAECELPGMVFPTSDEWDEVRQKWRPGEDDQE